MSFSCSLVSRRVPADATPPLRTVLQVSPKASLKAVDMANRPRTTGDAEAVEVGYDGHDCCHQSRCAGAEREVEKDGCRCHVLSPVNVGFDSADDDDDDFKTSRGSLGTR
jgi:hypothetical protein